MFKNVPVGVLLLHSNSIFNVCSSTGVKISVGRRRVAKVLQAMTSSSFSTNENAPNRLINERSPYLLQHAYNPVQWLTLLGTGCVPFMAWYPWGEEAFQKARDESKLIFLSVGYSTCHWCHVMEKESFENVEIAEILNKDFVPIKVDREERPDVDRVYMTFVQATTGHGGWPMSVWLTPSLKPYLGGTYFPPNDSLFRRGFKSVLKLISEKWKENKDGCNASADKILSSIQKAVEVKTDDSSSIPLLKACDDCVDQMIERFDEDMGGFSEAPKFPQPVNLDFLLKYHICNPHSEKGKTALEMVVKTLKAMSKGGIHDHVGFGFHRYSTDQFWHVPHFEKMLYDQGQLAVSYADCYAVTKDDALRETLRRSLDYVKRDLRHPGGGFYSAEDADSLPNASDTAKKEGAFYVWTKEEVRTHLGKDVIGNVSCADIFEEFYGVSDNGNVSFDQDPHGELRGKNVLIVRSTTKDIAHKMALDVTEVEEALQRSRAKLMAEREKRPRPHLDNKMITAWNALMISGYCRGACVMGCDVYKQVAIDAARFILNHLYLEDSNSLLRSCYSGVDGAVEQIQPPISGFDSDYAYTIRAFIDLFETSRDQSWLELAVKLQERQTELFWDDVNGGFFSVAVGDSSILLRMKEDQDGAEPSANSVSAFNLLRLSAYLNSDNLRHQCEKLLKAFSNRLSTTPFALPEMAGALLWLWKGHKQIVVRGDIDNESTRSLINCINTSYLPMKIVIPPEVNSLDGFLHRHLAGQLSRLTSTQSVDEPQVYVCENFTCQLPVSEVDALKKLF